MDLLTLDDAATAHEIPDGATTVTAILTAVTSDIATARTSNGEEHMVPITEWPYKHRWSRGERFIAMRHETFGKPTLTLTSPALVSLLATGIVPELRDGRVRIMGVAREPGSRTKLAVAATTPNVDAVAACVGRGASRIRMLISQLGGERVDVVAWDPDRISYLTNALAPARVGTIRIVDDAQVEVVTPRHQMAAAVGEGGLNSQLAGRLTGFDVSITSS